MTARDGRDAANARACRGSSAPVATVLRQEARLPAAAVRVDDPRTTEQHKRRPHESGAVSDLLLVEDVAALLHLSPKTVQEKAVRGLIPNRRMPGTRRCLFPRGDVEAWLAGAELETLKLAHDGRIVRPKAA